MKKQSLFIIGLFSLVLITTSCKKEECHECHYDTANGQVELGEKCGDELEDLEANGINVDGTNYEVHCHGH